MRRPRLALPASRLYERRRETGAGLFVALAIAAHLAAVGAFIALPRLADALNIGGAPLRQPPPATIEMIQENTPTVGASKQAKAATASTPAPARKGGAPAPLSAATSTEQVAANTGTSEQTAGPDASEQAPPDAGENATPAPEINLDLDDDDQPGTGIVDGPNVIPASPDAKHPNLPPVYPRDAAMHGEQGTVGLIVQIAPDGHPAAIQVASSSGHAALDAAAKRALERWHFRPGQEDGHAVASVLNQQIIFELGSGRR